MHAATAKNKNSISKASARFRKFAGAPEWPSIRKRSTRNGPDAPGARESRLFIYLSEARAWVCPLERHFAPRVPSHYEAVRRWKTIGAFSRRIRGL